MSLRTRLWLVLGGLFLVPIIVGVLVVTAVVMGADENRLTSLDVSTDAVAAELADDCTLAGLLARDVGFEAGGTSPDQAVGAAVGPSYGDYAALLGPGGQVVAESGTLPAGLDVSQLPSCSRARGAAVSAAVLADIVPVDGVEGVESSVVALRLDADGLRDLRRRAGTDGEIVLLSDGQVVASSLSGTAAETVASAADGRTGSVDADGWSLGVRGPARGAPLTVVVAMEDTGSGRTALLVGAILLAGALAAGLLVSVVARGLSQPFTDLTEAAERVAQGDLDTSIAASDEGEAGRLGSAFNQMTGELRKSLGELERSRADLHDSLERIGEALRSTHDLDGLLSVVLETATATLGATAGVVLYRRGDQLELLAEQGLARGRDARPGRHPAGAGRARPRRVARDPRPRPDRHRRPADARRGRAARR